MSAQLPLIARLTLRALGMAESKRGVRRSMDPVATWLAREHPRFLASKDSVAAFATIRARCAIIDELLLDEVGRAKKLGIKLSLWTFGGGFDARWYRLRSVLGRGVHEFWDVEEGSVMGTKQELLDVSPFSPLWSQVNQLAAPVKTWSLNIGEDENPVVILEGLAGRMDLDAIGALLERIRAASTRAHVIVGLPATVSEPERWSETFFSTKGWTLETDIRLGDRGRLLNERGMEMCNGMHGLRVIRLVARDFPEST